MRANLQSDNAVDLYRPTTANQLQHQNNQCHDQQNMNQVPGNRKGKRAEQPENEQNHQNRPQHSFPCLLSINELQINNSPTEQLEQFLCHQTLDHI